MTMNLRKLIIMVALMLSVGMVGAQDTDLPLEGEVVETVAARPLRAEVNVESAFVRLLPSFESDAATSVFDREILEVVGRNLNGLWFEVRRPGRMTNLGWIYHEMLEWDFNPTQLPLTDVVTGLNGVPVAGDSGFSAYALGNLNLRRLPLIDSGVLGLIPIGVTVPAFERNQDGSWLFVNYMGLEGWINRNSITTVSNILNLPMAMGLPPLPTANIVVIPPEIQLEQVERLRAYTRSQREIASRLSDFWVSVFRGETMPCEPPPFIVDYLYSGADVRELPELQRYVPRLGDASYHLNVAIELLTVCGAFDPSVIRVARNGALNAGIIYDATLGLLDNLEANVIR